MNGRRNINNKEKEKLLQGEVHKPNLMRVATELASYSSPHKMADILLLLLKGSTENSSDGNQNISLLFSDILGFGDKPK